MNTGKVNVLLQPMLRRGQEFHELNQNARRTVHRTFPRSSPWEKVQYFRKFMTVRLLLLPPHPWGGPGGGSPHGGMPSAGTPLLGDRSRGASANGHMTSVQLNSTRDTPLERSRKFPLPRAFVIRVGGGGSRHTTGHSLGVAWHSFGSASG